MLSFEMSTSSQSDLITIPHRASGLGTIQMSRTLLQAFHPHREQGTSDPEESEADLLSRDRNEVLTSHI